MFDPNFTLIADFFIRPALAQGAPQRGGGLDFIVFIILMLGIMYFLMIRPQVKRARQHREMVAALSKGDEIVTNGGLLGKILEVGETFLLVEVGRGVEVKVQKDAVANAMPRGTLKTL